MKGSELLFEAAKILDRKKASNLKAIRISDLTIVSEYFLIATATSNTHAKALADDLDFELEKFGRRPLRVEGYSSASWILVDYGEVVVHIFYGETRDFYSLERLWADGEQIDLSSVTSES